MGKRRQIVVGKIEFSTASQAKEFVRNLVARYPNGATASEPDADFLKDLLELHPHCEEKVGVGVLTFRFDQNPEYTNNRTIFIVRTDGSTTDFSWMKCIDGETPERLRRAALRNAVMDQIIVFKQQSFSQRQFCSETGKELDWKHCHVDHRAPKTFDKLVDDWLSSEGISIASIEISPSRDSSFVRILTNERQRDSWRRFHDLNKDLQLLTPFANLSIAKTRNQDPK